MSGRLRLIPLILAASLATAESLKVPLGLDRYIPAPESNPITRGKVELGRELFFFKGLSEDGSVACATCHDPGKSFTDGKSAAVGVRGQLADRRSPAIVNRAWGRSFFWDGRATTLEQQVLQPIVNPKEMGLTLEAAVDRVRANPQLSARFNKEFKRPPDSNSLAAALATYVRTILSGDSAYDRYVQGHSDALTHEASAGMRLFRGKANCIACHVGPNFTDEDFHNTGVAWREGKSLDPGRAAHTGDKLDAGKFKTPGLREVAGAAPYMHDGSIRTLAEVVDFYNDGGRANPNLDPEMRRLNLTPSEKHSLVAFLQSLSGMVQEGWPKQ